MTLGQEFAMRENKQTKLPTYTTNTHKNKIKNEYGYAFVFLIFDSFALLLLNFQYWQPFSLFCKEAMMKLQLRRTTNKAFSSKLINTYSSKGLSMVRIFVSSIVKAQVSLKIYFKLIIL